MQRAYSQLSIKGFNDERREFTGVATTPTPDRMGDIVEPMGAEFTLPIPLLWQHQADKPIGEITWAKPGRGGIPIKGRVFHAEQSRTLIDRLDEAWESIKLGLVKGLSIGFAPIEQAQIKDSWSYHFLKWNWLELSAVTIPANSEASIQTIKSIDREQRAASGQRAGVVLLGETLRRVRQKQGVVYLSPSAIQRIKQ